MNYFEMKEDMAGGLKAGDLVTATGGSYGPLIMTSKGVAVPIGMLKAVNPPRKDGTTVPSDTPASNSLLVQPEDEEAEAKAVASLSKSGSVGSTMSGNDKKTLADALGGAKEFMNMDAVDPSVRVQIPEGMEEEVEVLPEGQVRLSSLTEGRLPASGMDHIINIFKDDHFPEEIRSDIPVPHKTWYWNPDVLETIILGHSEDEMTLLVGLPGTGKSDGLRQFAGIIKQPFMRIGCRGDMESDSLLGYAWAVDGKMEFKQGLLPQGLQSGYMICLDEVMKMPAPIAMVCQEVWERNSRCLVLDGMPGTKAEKTIKATEDCRIYCTDNVVGTGDNIGMFGATQIQDSSSLDRYGLTERVPYMPQDIEVGILKAHHPMIKASALSELVKFGGLIRNSYSNGGVSVTLSPRGLGTMCRLIEKGFGLKAAIDKVYRHKLGTMSETVVLDTSLQTVKIV